jgi:hypothetical protein
MFCTLSITVGLNYNGTFNFFSFFPPMQAFRQTFVAFGARRKPLTSKQGNKNFYKGNRTGRLGRFTTKGHFILQEHKQRTFVIPDLSEFKLTPYCSPKAETVRMAHTARDYFREMNKVLDNELNEKCRLKAKELFKATTTRGVIDHTRK